jgi:hypothetical protein
MVEGSRSVGKVTDWFSARSCERLYLEYLEEVFEVLSFVRSAGV